MYATSKSLYDDADMMDTFDAAAVLDVVGGGLDRMDLEELTELLDKGESGLIVVAARDRVARIDGYVSHASEVMRKNLKFDKQQICADIEAATALEAASAD